MFRATLPLVGLYEPKILDEATESTVIPQIMSPYGRSSDIIRSYFTAKSPEHLLG